ncbi:N-acetylglucosamine-6-phosphate deacetylase [Cytobacillus sp. IB215316]|uniref:N-acetylglucosamine-6-phosphate deacetylase n=1 Tax=Cytobacillus sp. IB215316 TaxID=3097354 RepID=UPI002A1368BC|nr:N-acetylglucosamine-6-phosphate deacetylase [Cytobacillus sp. IB215316]MDX8360825.1 N-acetylglucosamine-6-phosphate deacetylase [Cytobacillus sp. IB215316]
MLIKGLTIYAEDRMIEQGTIKITDGKIESISQHIDEIDTNIIQFPNTYKCLPGLIDVHIHGAHGSDIMDASSHALDTISKALPQEGTTSYLATTITQHQSKIEQALFNVGNYMESQNDGQAEILGVHLEGPFINSQKAGAQPYDYILEGDISLFKSWQKLSGNNIKLVTLAPEINNGLALIKYLSSNGVVASIGHSNATYDQVVDAISVGASHITHLFNGMSGLHHREPGVVGAAMMRDELFVEMIVDGIHVSPKMIELAYRYIGCERTILVTDAMRAKCLRNGIYDLGGQNVHVKNGKATLDGGALAGSLLTMDQAMQNILTYTNAPLTELTIIASKNPAKQCGVFDRKGSIKENKDADLIILDEQNNLVMTICRGVISYER